MNDPTISFAYEENVNKLKGSNSIYILTLLYFIAQRGSAALKSLVNQKGIGI